MFARRVGETEEARGSSSPATAAAISRTRSGDRDNNGVTVVDREYRLFPTLALATCSNDMVESATDPGPFSRGGKTGRFAKGLFLYGFFPSELDTELVEIVVEGDPNLGGLELKFFSDPVLPFTLLLLRTCRTRSLSRLSSAFRWVCATLLASSERPISGLKT